MKNMENTEIGELIQEITAKGFDGIEIDLVPGDEFDNAGFACVTVDSGTDESRFTVEADSLIVALGLIVDSIRYQRNEPSREEELAIMLRADDLHAAAPPVNLGPTAACHCGSRKPLVVERPVKVFFPWDGSQPQFDSVFGIMGIAGPANAGEIGTCPDCGSHWTFRA